MNLSFLPKSDKETFQKLILLSGCSDLLDSKEATSLLGKLSRDEYIESCRSLNKNDIVIASKGRSDQDLVDCVHEAARSSNAHVLSYFLDSRPGLFGVPNNETGNLPLHTYLK